MKNFILTVLLVSVLSLNVKSQEKYSGLNLGVGLGYYGTFSSPALHLNYEFDVFKNFTLAPFITFQTKKSNYPYFDNNMNMRNAGYRYYYVPIGLKGSYYFDELFNAGEKWDFWAAASLGYAIRRTTWTDGYNGVGYTDVNSSPIYGNLHIGAELHLSEKVGMFLEMSTGLSTFGFAFH